jgi:hypothetical protein
MTWMTPFDWITSAMVTLATPPFSSVIGDLAVSGLQPQLAAADGVDDMRRRHHPSPSW